MDLIIFIGFLFTLFGNTASYPLPFPFPFPVPSIYGAGSGYGAAVHSNQILTPFANIGSTVNGKISQAVNSKSVQFNTPFPDSGRQSAVLESAARETIPIQADIKYANLQQFVANLLNPRPLVDTIQEHEKYGNDGSKGRALGTYAVAAFEGLSNVLNAAVDVPFQAIKIVGRKITDSLNQVGGKIVGLA